MTKREKLYDKTKMPVNDEMIDSLLSKYFIINYSKDDGFIKRIINDMEERIQFILSFFDVDDLSEKITINIISSKEKFDKIFYEVHKFTPDLNAVGFYHNKEVTYLAFSEFKKTNHKNDTYDDFINILIHECVHNIHSYITNDNMSLRCINEGIALYLGKQFIDSDYTRFNCSLDDLLNQKNIDYYNYYLIFKYIYENFEKETTFNFIKSKDFAINNLKLVYDKVVKKI